MSYKDYLEWLSLNTNIEKVAYLETSSKVVASFGKNQKSREEFPNALTSEIIVINAGGTPAKEISISNGLPLIFDINYESCANIKSFGTCNVPVTLNSFENNTYNETVTISFNNGYDMESKEYYITATSGEYGLIKALNANNNLIQSDSYTNYGEFIIGTTQNISINIKNIGEKALNINFVEDNTEKLNDEGNLEFSETQKRLETSTCSEQSPPLQPNETCSLNYEVTIVDANPKRIPVKINYSNPDEEKEYRVGLEYSGKTPPNIKIEFTGENTPEKFAFKEVPKLTSKEKSFFLEILEIRMLKILK